MRLFRLFTTHRDWVERFLADPTIFGVADTYGIELMDEVWIGPKRRPIAVAGDKA